MYALLVFLTTYCTAPGECTYQPNVKPLTADMVSTEAMVGLEDGANTFIEFTTTTWEQR